MRNKLTICFMIALVTASGAYANPEPPIEGKKIFMSRCAGCHNVNKPLTGPALAGIDERRSLDWIINFVHSSQSMVKNGDKEAVALYEKFNKVPMPDHKDLSEENIKSIVEFIKTEAKPADKESAPFSKPGGKKPEYTTIDPSDYWLFACLMASIILLIGVMIFASRVRMMMEKNRTRV